ncbi:MAG TPA: aminoacetone oxidase family FAD-binding enzyme, partial [Phycisphaerales bacterium]|nr:aminoacetone oxidase family FAD-binding enzyme [Phycisphaerales bacterium]
GKDGCVFPVTNRAADVKRILEDTARRLNIRFIYGKQVETIEKQPGGFVTTGGKERINSGCVIIATGGVSWPFTGSTGDGYGFAEAFGHKVFKPVAALVPLITKENWPGKLQGVGIVKVRLSGNKITSTGPLMFTGDGIGGPVSQDFSREIADQLADCSDGVEVCIDMMPDTDEAGLDKLIVDECAKQSRKELAGVLAVFLPRKMSIFLCDRIKPTGQILVSQFAKADRAKLVTMIKSLPLTIEAARPIEEATVTRGGIDTGEIDDKTMESKLCEGLFFAGEVIDADGPCGGYNLQICWSTGALAGKMAAEKSKK